MKKIIMNELKLEESNFLSNSEKKEILGGNSWGMSCKGHINCDKGQACRNGTCLYVLIPREEY